MSIQSCQVLFVLGCPGSGKSTECNLLGHELGAVHIAAGELLRAQLGQDNDRSRAIEELMKEGKLVPSEWTLDIVIENIQLIVASRPNALVLLDGFPRNESNLRLWNERVTELSTLNFEIHTIGILAIECDLPTIETRLLARSQTAGRIDDTLDTIRKRYASHINETLPVINSFEPSTSVIRVNGWNSPQLVHEQVMESLVPLLDSINTK